MRTNYISKDGLVVRADIDTYKFDKNLKNTILEYQYETPLYYIGRMERAYCKSNAVVHSINLTSTTIDTNVFDCRELDIAWTDLPYVYRHIEETNCLNKMMEKLKPAEEYLAELISESIFKEDNELENVLEKIISGINFKSLSSPYIY